MGFIGLKNLSDKQVTDPNERVKVNMTLHCRIMKIDINRFNVDLTSKSSDLLDAESKWKLPKDTFYDVIAEQEDTKKDEEKKKQKARQSE